MIFLANFLTGVSAGAEESYGDFGNDLAYVGAGPAGTANVKINSRPFVSLDVGGVLSVTGGSGWVVGLYPILSVSGGKATISGVPASGSPGLAGWVLNPGVAANVMMQELSGREAMQYAARGKNVTHRGFFSSDVGLTNRHRITWQGSFLRVKACYKRGRPGEDLLWIAELELITTRMETASV